MRKFKLLLFLLISILSACEKFTFNQEDLKKLKSTKKCNKCNLKNTNLYKLDLSSNKLSGSIPSQLGNLSSLNSLRLFNNQLSGEVPLSIFNLLELEFLFLQDNHLSGVVPIEFKNMPRLIDFKYDIKKTINNY